MIVGQGDYTYRVIEGWGKHFYSPFVEAAAVDLDSKDNVYTFIRSVAPILVFDSKGNFLRLFGIKEGFIQPHGICVDDKGFIYTADTKNHTVMKFSPEGKLLMTLGTMNRPSDTGYIPGKGALSITRAAGPFNRPTDVAVDRRGNIYVTDGYGNARVHKFSKEGELLLSWGEPGKGPGQFNTPHSIHIDDEGILWICDRENSRIQLFDPEGKFVDEWDNLNRPADVRVRDKIVYVCELGFIEGPGDILPGMRPKDGVRFSRMSILTLNKELLSRWGTEDADAPGSFASCNGVAVDSQGSIYVCETSVTGGSIHKDNHHTLQKFERNR